MAYKLHGECGRLINLYDWMQSWVAVVAGREGEEEDEDKGRNSIRKYG